MSYNLGERIKPKRHWRLKPLFFTVVILVLFAGAYFYATGKLHLP
jgi:hypothetical protein